MIKSGLAFLLFALSLTAASCLDLDEEKREREAKYGPDSLVKPEISPLDTVFFIHVLDDYISVTGLGICTFHSTWAEVDTLMRKALIKKPGVKIYVEELGSDPKMVDTAEDILLKYNIEEYTRVTNPKYPVYSTKYIEKEK